MSNPNTPLSQYRRAAREVLDRVAIPPQLASGKPFSLSNKDTERELAAITAAAQELCLAELGAVSIKMSREGVAGASKWFVADRIAAIRTTLKEEQHGA